MLALMVKMRILKNFNSLYMGKRDCFATDYSVTTLCPVRWTPVRMEIAYHQPLSGTVVIKVHPDKKASFDMLIPGAGHCPDLVKHVIYHMWSCSRTSTWVYASLPSTYNSLVPAKWHRVYPLHLTAT